MPFGKRSGPSQTACRPRNVKTSSDMPDISSQDEAALDIGTLEGLTEPTTRGSRRLAGIDLNKARNRHVVDAVIELSTKPDGFTVSQLAQAVRPRYAKPFKSSASPL